MNTVLMLSNRMKWENHVINEDNGNISIFNDMIDINILMYLVYIKGRN